MLPLERSTITMSTHWYSVHILLHALVVMSQVMLRRATTPMSNTPSLCSCTLKASQIPLAIYSRQLSLKHEQAAMAMATHSTSWLPPWAPRAQ